LIRDCAGEIGAGAYAGDMDGLSSPPAYDDHGLFAHMTWPNKNNLTCVRDQGSRGTCGAFAIAGVLETAVAQKTRAESNGVAQFLNLSEQWIYGIYRQSFYPQDFDEGRAMPDSKLVFQALANPNITIPFEIGWEYNKSKSREEFGEPPNGFYADSCVGYSGKPVDGQGPWCSETTHQTRLIYTKVVTQYGLETFAAYALPVVPPGGARIASIGLNLWNDASRDTSLGLAILMLRQGYPMQGGWRGQTSTKKTIVVPTAPGIWEEFPGYVPFPLEDFAPVPALGENFVTPSPGGGDPDEKTDGGHNFHLAGFISNAELRAAVQANPEFVPLLGDQGDYGERSQDLGGWFIIRNSLGRDAGDRGFYYIPVGWAYKNFGGTNAITSAEEVLP
jgi:hypothetical protein